MIPPIEPKIIYIYLIIKFTFSIYYSHVLTYTCLSPKLASSIYPLTTGMIIAKRIKKICLNFIINNIIKIYNE